MCIYSFILKMSNGSCFSNRQLVEVMQVNQYTITFLDIQTHQVAQFCTFCNLIYARLAPFPYTRDPSCGIRHAIYGYFNFAIKM